MARPRTKPSTPRLSEFARHVAVPKSATSTGWPAVRDKCRDLGITFRPWQPGVGQIVLAKRADGKYAATIGGTGLAIPRQVGKTFLVGAIVFALCLLNPKMTVIWTSHRLRTSQETFKKMQGFARRAKIKPFVSKIVLGSGDEEIQFRNGSRILFGARERGFGRGFDEVDVLIFDEGQILSDNALDDMIPAMNQSRLPTGGLLLFMGTPPKPSDPSDPWLRMRADALTGQDEDTGWVEFGADPGYIPTPKPADLTAADWAQVTKANPSYPGDTPREAILRMRKKLGDESFRREGLGIYDDAAANLVMPNWPNCKAVGVEPSGLAAIGIAIDIERVWVSLGGASTDEHPHLGSRWKRRLDTNRAFIVSEAKRIQTETACAVVIDRKGPAGSLEEDLIAAGVNVTPAGLDDYVTACAGLFDAVNAKEVTHGGYPELDEAVAAATKRKVGDRWAWARRDGDISMLEAVTLAHWGAIHAASGPLIFT